MEEGSNPRPLVKRALCRLSYPCWYLMGPDDNTTHVVGDVVPIPPLPEPSQVELLEMHCRHARAVWNLGLEQRSFWTRGRGQLLPRLSVYEQKRSLTEARQHTWLSAGSSVVQQAALWDLERAFRNWWTNPGHFSRPTWRKAGIHEGFAIRDLTIERVNRRWATIVVPKLGWYGSGSPGRGRSSPQPRLLGVTFDRAGRWHVSLTAPQPALSWTRTGAVRRHRPRDQTATATTSDRDQLTMGDLLSLADKADAAGCNAASPARPRARRRAATKAAFARLSAREVDRRKDWIERTTTALVRYDDLIAIEDLAVKNMVRTARGTIDEPGVNVAQKRGLNRSIHTQAWGLFRTRLEHKAAAAVDHGTPRPVVVIAVNPAYTSQRCSACGHTAKENRKSQVA